MRHKGARVGTRSRGRRKKTARAGEAVCIYKKDAMQIAMETAAGPPR